MAKKGIGIAKPLFILFGALGVAFFLFENKTALASSVQSATSTISELIPIPTASTTSATEDAALLDNVVSNAVVVASAPIVTVAEDIELSATALISTPEALESLVAVLSNIETTPLVIGGSESDFLSPEALADPKAFNEQKFGIDTDLLLEAATTPEADLTTAQKLALEAAKATEVFDSSGITNF